jgi:hypothetical protein
MTFQGFVVQHRFFIGWGGLLLREGDGVFIAIFF